MKPREGTISKDRQHRPALATGLPTHRVPVRQVSPRRGGALWRRRSFQYAGVVLVATVVGVLLYVGGATQGEVAQPAAAPPPDVAENTPETDALADVVDESAVVTPIVVPAADNTSVPTATVLPAVLSTAIAPTRAPVSAIATSLPQATNGSAPPISEVWVGNTGGSGVYVRETPSVAHRLRAYNDGTQLTIIGEDVTGEGQQWKHIRTPDGLEGYVPAQYVTETAP